jgi:hypothetical protein
VAIGRDENLLISSKVKACSKTCSKKSAAWCDKKTRALLA